MVEVRFELPSLIPRSILVKYTLYGMISLNNRNDNYLIICLISSWQISNHFHMYCHVIDSETTVMGLEVQTSDITTLQTVLLKSFVLFMAYVNKL